MTPALRKKIDELIALDAAYEAEQERRSPNKAELKFDASLIAEQVKAQQASPALAVLTGLSNDDLAYVMALAWWGRWDGIAETDPDFSAVLVYAKINLGDGTASYVHGMPLSKYLSRGLKRLGIE